MNTSGAPLERMLARVLHAGAIASTVLLTAAWYSPWCAAGSVHHVLTTADC